MKATYDAKQQIYKATFSNTLASTSHMTATSGATCSSNQSAKNTFLPGFSEYIATTLLMCMQGAIRRLQRFPSLDILLTLRVAS